MGVKTQIPLPTIAQVIKLLWKASGDIVICVSGDEGIGKSTLAYWIAILTQPDFDLETQIAYFADDANNLMFRAPSESVVWLDENPFYKRDSAKSESKWGNKVMMRSRFKKRCYIFCSPRLADLDKYFREHRIKLWLRVVERGRAEVFEPLKVEDGDPWNLDDERKMLIKNGRGFVKFEAMPKEHEEIYTTMKVKGFEELQEEYENENNGHKVKETEKKGGKMKVEQVVRLANQINVTEKEACNILGYNYQSHKTMKSQFHLT